MTAPVLTGADGFLARYAAMRDRLPGDLAIRDSAAEFFRRMGLPGRRVEAWKYTDLRPIAAAAFHEPVAPRTDCSGLLARLPRIDAPRLVFVDGCFRDELSDLPSRAHLVRFHDWAALSGLAKPDQEPLVALNTMLAEDGTILEIPGGVDAGVIHLVSLTANAASGATDFHPRHAIRLGAGARLVVFETSLGEGSYLQNAVTEIHIDTAAALSHIRLQNESPTAFNFTTIYAEIGERGTYDTFTFNLGARMTRTEIHARIAGPDAVAHLNGAQLLSGTQHGDITTIVRHDAPHGTSRQTVKNVLAGRSRGVFQGRIEVTRCAQKTDGYQMNQALLLSPDAEIDTKPELEIFADDVKCSHGATVGELDANQLFYLRSRGIPDAEARSILVRAFLAEALDVVSHDRIRAALEDAVAEWWERQAA